MLTVIEPATQTRLTTVSTARKALALNEADYSDEAVEKMIDQASQSIVEFCGRSFGREKLQETFRGHETCGDGVMLSRSPVMTIDSILCDGEAVILPGYEIDRTDVLYRLEDNFRYPWRSAIMVVTYDAGYVLPSDEDGAPESTLPATIEQAALDEISAYISYADRDALVKSETVEALDRPPTTCRADQLPCRRLALKQRWHAIDLPRGVSGDARDGHRHA